ncbi:MAG: hypothetical protein GTO63_18345, partial [Anaerolineae bacterium]|nr:hypothetical protein [Anaerolineae bacterium]NIN96731.1 hypothetical protein [Anaerolineae bacterium]
AEEQAKIDKIYEAHRERLKGFRRGDLGALQHALSQFREELWQFVGGDRDSREQQDAMIQLENLYAEKYG